MHDDGATARFRAYRSHRYVTPLSIAVPACTFIAMILVLVGLGVLVPIGAVLVGVGTWLRRLNLRVTLDLGADGVHYASRFEKRFVKWSEVEAIAHDARGISLRLAGGRRPLAFSVAIGEIMTLDAVEEQAALLQCARRAYAAFEPDASAGVSARIMRGGRSTAEWLASLGGGTTFRSPSLREDDLWRIVEDPAAAPTARAGAAVVLARGANESQLERLGAAASGCAEPHLRVVLEHAASGEDPTAALEDVDDDPRSTRPPTRPQEV